MELWRLEPGGRVRWMALSALGFVAVVAGCERDDPPAVDRNRPPDTFITQGPDLSHDPRNPVNLYYRAQLHWRGEDPDGRVVGFRLALDDTSDPSLWSFTTSTDSVFRFPVAEIGPLEHLFLVRAVDNLGKQDPTPDTLRFESFTTSPPTVRLVEICGDMPTLGFRCGLSTADTVEAFSDVTWLWTGSDEDGEIVRWRIQFDAETPIDLSRADTVYSVNSLDPGTHTLTVNAFDDAGAISREPGRFKIVSNFDPVTMLDRSSVVATLERDWLDGSSMDSTLVIEDIVGDPNAPPDTVPFNSRISMCWSATDIDGPICAYDYFFTSAVIGRIESPDCMSVPPDTCAAPLERLSIGSSLGTRGGVFLVRGIDTYGRATGHPDTLRLFVNFRPEVHWVDDGILERPPGLHTFAFDGYDKDSDPNTLEFNWNRIGDQQTGDWRTLTGPNRRVDYFFTPGEVGQVQRIVLKSRDFPARLESAADTLLVRIVPVAPEASR